MSTYPDMPQPMVLRRSQPERSTPRHAPPRKESTARSINKKNPPSTVTDLPGWSDLTTENEILSVRQVKKFFLDKVSTSQFLLGLFALSLTCTIYVSLVNATQDLATNVQQARRENFRMHLKHNQLKGLFDQSTGPSVVYQRAKEMGLVEDYHFGPSIILQEETPQP